MRPTLTNLYLVRHAAPNRNTGLPYRRMPGPGLTAEGREEARQAAAFLADKGLEHLYVSPFARAEQTAEVLVSQLDLPATFTRLLAEHEDTETLAEVQERIRGFLDMLQAANQPVAGAVTHGTPIREMLLHLTNQQLDLSQYLHENLYGSSNPAPTAGIWHLHRKADSEVWQASLVFVPLELV